MAEIHLTAAGLAKMKAELTEIKTVKRQKIIVAIQEARAQGDLSENAEYDAAKEAQAHNEKRISDLEDQISRSRIIDESTVPKDKISIGKKVKLKDLTKGKTISYTLVAPEEADFEELKISVTSPIGKGLIGKMIGDEVDIVVPAGKMKFKVLEMSME